MQGWLLQRVLLVVSRFEQCAPYSDRLLLQGEFKCSVPREDVESVGFGLFKLEFNCLSDIVPYIGDSPCFQEKTVVKSRVICFLLNHLILFVIFY